MKGVFHQNLGLLRRRKRVSQRQVAADLCISQALLSHYENGIREPGLNFVNRACAYYEVTADCLLGRTELETTKPETGCFDETSVAAFISVLNRSGQEPLAQAALRCYGALTYRLLHHMTGANDARFAAMADQALASGELEFLCSLKPLADTLQLETQLAPLMQLLDAQIRTSEVDA